MTGAEVMRNVSALGATLRLNDHLKIEIEPASLIPLDLRQAVTAHRDEIISILSGQGPIRSISQSTQQTLETQETPPPTFTLNVTSQGFTRVSGSTTRWRPDHPSIGAAPVERRCGQCRLWQRSEHQEHMGWCSAGRRAHGWHDGNPMAQVEIHEDHRCVASEGKAYLPVRNC